MGPNILIPPESAAAKTTMTYSDRVKSLRLNGATSSGKIAKANPLLAILGWSLAIEIGRAHV